MTEYRFLNIRDVGFLISCKRSSIYRWIRDGVFPPPIKRGKSSSVWGSDEVAEWMDATRRGVDGDEMRLMVARIVAKRKSGGL